MFTSSLASLVLAGTLGYPSPLRFDPDKSWTGRTVIMKKTGTRFFQANVENVEVVVGTLARTDYVVVRETDTRIWIKQDGVEGWIPKEDAALPEDGVEHFSKLIRENPNDSSNYARRSKAHELKGDLEAALKDYDEAIRISPGTSSWYNNRANLLNRKKDFDAALRDYTRAIQMNPGSAIVHGNRGNAHSNLRDFDQAIQDYTESLRLSATYINALANRGNAYRETRRYDKALADYAAALKIDSRFAYALASRGGLWTARGDLTKAEADINAACAIDPRSALAFLQRGNLRRAQKRHQLALDDYAHAIWLDPRLTSAYVERGIARRELKQYDKALADFDKALEIEAKSPFAMSAKAWLLATCPDAKLRDGKKALELAKSADERCKTKEPRYMEALAAAHAETGDFDAAVALQKSVVLDAEYVKENGDGPKKRLDLYSSKMPFREE
jgi:tetratricopeptide (TPR) repeat protein